MLYRALGVVQGRPRTDVRDCVGVGDTLKPPFADALSQFRMGVRARNDLQLRLQQTTVRVSRPLGWGRARLARTAAAKHAGQLADGSILSPTRRGHKGEPAVVLRARVSTPPTAARSLRRS